MNFQVLIISLSVGLLIGGIHMYGVKRFEAGYNECALAHAQAARNNYKREHSASVTLERELAAMEQRYDITTKRILEVIKSLPCEHLSPEFMELYNELNSY
jgi:hypothetical protein